MVRDGYVWYPVECPLEYRIVSPGPGDFQAAVDALEGREPSAVRLATVLTAHPAAKFAHDVETDQWYKRGRKSRAAQG